MELRLSAIALSLTLLTHARGAQEDNTGSDEFFSHPGLIRTTEGATATFHWQTKQDVQQYQRIVCHYLQIAVVEFYSPRLTLFDDQYIDRISGSISGREFGFNLTSVTEMDIADNYTLQLSLPGGIFCRDISSLAIYRTPTKPIIDVSEPFAPNQGYTVTCKADSTSVPAVHRLPVEYTWTAEEGSMDVGYTVTGEYNETLSLFNPDVSKGHDIHVTCVAREQGSSLSSSGSEHIHITGNNPAVNDTEDKKSDEDFTMGGFDGTTLIITIASVTGVILVAMASIVGYLCWERKHRPDRSRRRNNQIRQSLTLSGLRRGRSHHGLSVDFDSQREIYWSIRHDDVKSTIDTRNVPTLPKRPSPVGGDESYDYADPERLGLAARCDPEASKRLLADGTEDPESFSYGSATDLDSKIKKDVDLYMGEVVDSKPATAAPKPAVYAMVNKQKSDVEDETETSIIDNDAYHSACGGKSESSMKRMTPGTSPPPPCGERNSYVASPTRNKHTREPVQGDPPMDKVTSNAQSGVPDTPIESPNTDLYFLAKSPSDEQGNPPPVTGHGHSPDNDRPANCDIYSLVSAANGEDYRNQPQPSSGRAEDMYQMATSLPRESGDRQNNITADEHELEIVDNESYVPS